jgi:formylglycine-generating enzyme required for sulfatase activity
VARYDWLPMAGCYPHQVAQKQPNPWGLYDLHGNMTEWVEDWYAVYPARELIDPTGPRTGTHKVRRGYAWDVGGARSAGRVYSRPTDNGGYGGFRVVFGGCRAPPYTAP